MHLDGIHVLAEWSDVLNMSFVLNLILVNVVCDKFTVMFS